MTIFKKLERGPLKTSACQLTAAVKITYRQTLADLLKWSRIHAIYKCTSLTVFLFFLHRIRSHPRGRIQPSANWIDSAETAGVWTSGCRLSISPNDEQKWTNSVTTFTGYCTRFVLWMKLNSSENETWGGLMKFNGWNVFQQTQWSEVWILCVMLDSRFMVSHQSRKNDSALCSQCFQGITSPAVCREWDCTGNWITHAGLED